MPASTCRSIVAIVLALTGVSSPVFAGVAEQDVKAAYVVNVLRFVRPKAQPVDRENLVLCLVAAGSIAQPLRTLENSTIGQRKLKVQILKNSNLQGCEVVFFGHSKGEEELIAKAKRAHLLTIGNDSTFLQRSGLIALLIENRRVVVELNPRAIAACDWILSSHLLEVARVTTGESL